MGEGDYTFGFGKAKGVGIRAVFMRVIVPLAVTV